MRKNKEVDMFKNKILFMMMLFVGVSFCTSETDEPEISVMQKIKNGATKVLKSPVFPVVVAGVVASFIQTNIAISRCKTAKKVKFGEIEYDWTCFSYLNPLSWVARLRGVSPDFGDRLFTIAATCSLVQLISGSKSEIVQAGCALAAAVVTTNMK
jgi:hypothetical protein